MKWCSRGKDCNATYVFRQRPRHEVGEARSIANVSRVAVADDPDREVERGGRYWRCIRSWQLINRRHSAGANRVRRCIRLSTAAVRKRCVSGQASLTKSSSRRPSFKTDEARIELPWKPGDTKIQRLPIIRSRTDERSFVRMSRPALGS